MRRLALCALLALSGCGSSKPAPEREPAEERRGPRPVTSFDRAPAIAEFCRKVSELNARGWPAELRRADDGKVLARVVHPVSAGEVECDLGAFERELVEQLVAQGVLAVELSPDAAPAGEPASGPSSPPKTGRRAAPQTEPPAASAPTHAPDTGRGTAPATQPAAEDAPDGALRVVSRIEAEPGAGTVITIQLVGARPLISTRASSR